MIDWEDLTKDDCVLCILRDKATKRLKDMNGHRITEMRLKKGLKK